jgi:phospholipid-translocating ATPase
MALLNSTIGNLTYVQLSDLSGTSPVLIIPSYFLLLSTLIPVSMFVSLEVIRMISSLFLAWDADCYDLETGHSLTVSNSSLLEEPGQVQILFSDKTGTLTDNKLEFKSFFATKSFA